MNDIFLRRCQSVGSICKRNQKDDNYTNLSICRLRLLNSSSSWDFCWMQSTHIENGSGGIFYLVPLSFIWSNFHFLLSGPTFTFLYLVPYSLFWSYFHFLLFGPSFTFFYPLSLLYILLRQSFPPFTFYWHCLCCSKFTFSVVLLSTVSSFVYHLNLSKNSCQITLFPLLAHMCPSYPFPVFAFA